LVVSSGFDQPSTIALASNLSPDVAAPIVEGLPTIRPESLVSLATPPLVDAHVDELYVGNTDLPGHHKRSEKPGLPIK
jgi:hypothetical protein